MRVINVLNKNLKARSGIQLVGPETVATVARKAVKELLEQRQCKFE